MSYYLFKTEQEAITALNYVNQVGLSLFPPERVTPEGIISLNALTGLPDLNAVKTTSWDTVKELKRGEKVGWYFTVPTEEIVGMALPPLEIPGEYEVVDNVDNVDNVNNIVVESLVELPSLSSLPSLPL